MSSDEHFDDALDRAKADRGEAVDFLGQIIPDEDKARMRQRIFNHVTLEGFDYFGFGMNVEKALRAGGFNYDPRVMEHVWSSWLEEAVLYTYRSKDKEDLTDSLRARVERYERQQPLPNPPLCPRISEERIAEIKRQLEELYHIAMPETGIEYSERIEAAFTLFAPPYDLDKLDYVRADRDRYLAKTGLTKEEIGRIVSSRHTIFLRQKDPFQSLGLCSAAWHELAHVAASAIGIQDRALSEGFAIANEFRALLQAALNGEVSRDEAICLIEYRVKCAESEQAGALMLVALSQVGLRGITEEQKTAYHHQALEFIRAFNPTLDFQSRSPEVLVVELDNAIASILATWRKRKRMSQLPLVVIPCAVVGAFIAFLIIVSLVG